MHRAAFLVAGIGTTLLLAGCGDQTITASESAQGLSISIVVTSDSSAITSLETSLKSSAAGAGVTIANGDAHTGTHVCGFSASKNGHNYQVDIYGTAPASTCNAAAKASFLSDAP